MKKIIALIMIVSFALITISTFTAIAQEKAAPEKSMFQKMSDSLSDFKEEHTGEKRPLHDVDVFQKAKDRLSLSNLKNAVANAKQHSLRSPKE